MQLLQQKMREEEIERDKERERQRQAQKGKEKAKPTEGDNDRKPSDSKQDAGPIQGDKGKEIEKPKSRKGKGEVHNGWYPLSLSMLRYSSVFFLERRNKSLSGPSGRRIISHRKGYLPCSSPPAETPAGQPSLGPSSYPPVPGGDSSPEKDLEELMLMEAIRLSLMESGTGTLLACFLLLKSL